MSKSADEFYRDGLDAEKIEKNLEKALELNQKAAQTDPKFSKAYFSMASCLNDQ